ncbi:uncharacterized protein [Aristolochia californica]|uniref:uncharacterized protein isoform X2 n=1 Tax=Aristolochia californica TaxID=171875 RepID=UPI0035D9CB52
MIAGLTSGFSSVVQLSLDKRFFRIQRFNQPKLCFNKMVPDNFSQVFVCKMFCIWESKWRYWIRRALRSLLAFLF